MFDWDTKNKEVAASIAGTVLSTLSVLGYVLVDVPIWISFIVLAFGMFMIFPYRVKEFFRIVGSKLPTFVDK